MIYTVNVSSINDFMQCRYRWLCKWVLNRVPRTEGRALTFGKLLHKVFEYKLTDTLTMTEAIELQREAWSRALYATTDPDEKATAVDALIDIDHYTDALKLWEDQYPFEIPVLEVEQPFRYTADEYSASDIAFVGRPDRMGVLWGKLYHVQNRGLAANTHFRQYTRLARRHLHEHVYAWAMKKKYPQYQYGGTVMNLLRKVKYRSNPSKAFPTGRILHPISDVLWQDIVNISPEENEKMMHEAVLYAQEMRAAEFRYREYGEMPLPNENMNNGYFHNTIDPYFLVLQGEVELSDNKLFKDREVLYGVS